MKKLKIDCLEKQQQLEELNSRLKLYSRVRRQRESGGLNYPPHKGLSSAANLIYKPGSWELIYVSQHGPKPVRVSNLL